MKIYIVSPVDSLYWYKPEAAFKSKKAAEVYINNDYDKYQITELKLKL